MGILTIIEYVIIKSLNFQSYFTTVNKSANYVGFRSAGHIYVSLKLCMVLFLAYLAAIWLNNIAM